MMPTYPLYKSVAAALLFSIFFGPIGLLYASFWGGFVMTAIGIVVLSSKQILISILFWVACSIWSVRAVEMYNQRLANFVQSPLPFRERSRG